MIELLQAKTGDYTIKFNGKFLASQVNPREEARKWVAQEAATLKGCRSVFVLGAGAGYHLLELRAQFPHITILVLEKEEKILEAIRSSLEVSFLGVQFINPLKKNIFSDQGTQKALSGTYRVLQHPSARIIDGPFYTQICDDLNGRTEKGFDQIMSIRQRQGCGLAGVEIKTANSILSIKDLELSEGPLVFQAMQELIR